jgi:DNA-binding transcriptional LysR family regulator
MTYDQLAAFLAVAREGAFTAAAARLHKSQPAVSKLVKNLEHELGVELFDRSGYRARLSDAGRRFRERAEAVVAGTDALAGFGRALGGAVEPIVRLAIDAVVPLAPIVRALRAVEKRFAAVQIELATERLSGALDALRDDRADLAVATKLGTGSAKLDAARWGRVRVLPVARRDHPLAKHRGAVPRALLRAHAQIVLSDSGADPDAPSLNVLEGGLRWTVTDVAAKKEVILAGMGWGGLPEHVAADALAAKKLVALHIPDFDRDAMELFVLRRGDRAHGPATDALYTELTRTTPHTR